MSAAHVVDEAIIHASTAIVWEALLAELEGARRWWYPDASFEPGDRSPRDVDGETQLTVYTKGAGNGGRELRSTARVIELEPERRIAFDYVAGSFDGGASYDLVPRDGGRTTKLVLMFAGALRNQLLARIVSLEEGHSVATQAAFRRLDALVWTDTGSELAAAS